MYIQDITKILALPHGAADTEPIPLLEFKSPRCWCVGKKSFRCFAQAIGPIPGPPPPWGMQKVLCKLIWHTSGPKVPGLAIPTKAFKFAPSM